MTIKKFIKNWLFSNDVEASSTPQPYNDVPEADKSIQFKIWFAQGGRVIQTRRYDLQQDKIYTSMYVIHEDQHVGQELEKIILKESLYS